MGPRGGRVPRRAPADLSARLEIILAFAATMFIPIYFSLVDVLFPFIFLLSYLYRCNALNSCGDICGVVLLSRFSYTQRLTCWVAHGIVDDLMQILLDLCSVC